MNRIVIPCPFCSATGIKHQDTIIDDEVIHQDIVCPKCLGAKVISMMFLSDDFIDFLNSLNDKVNDIMDKCNDIFEQVSE